MSKTHMVSTGAPTEIVGRRYQLQRRLGSGGMGAVYLATDRLTGDLVALKRVVTRPANGDGESLRLALTTEFRTLASLRHPNVIGVLDYGFDDDRQPFFTMPFVDDARSLREAAASQPLMRRIEYIIQLLQALVYLHRRGIIHRDLKPDNALVTPDGQVRVLDFGLALGQHRARAERYAGTLRYMAPELLQGGSPDEASDLYAVGVIAYELLTGRHAFTGSTAQELIADILTREPDMTGIDILTSGELRRAARHAVASDETLPPTLLSRELPTELLLDQTLILADTEPQDEATTAIPTEPYQRRSVPPVASGRDYGSASPFVRIIGQLLAKSPARRYQDAGAVIRDLRAALNQPLAPESSDIRESFLQAARFVGRDLELKWLVQAMQNAVKGSGSLWLVGGESGVGKSRLLEELRTVAMVQGVAVLRGQASDEGQLYPLWRDPLRRMALSVDMDDADAAVLKPFIPDIERLLDRKIGSVSDGDPAEQHEQFLASIRRLLERYCAASRDGVLLMLEDIHWASKSLTVLDMLRPLVYHLPLLVVCSYRNDEAPDLPNRLDGCQTLQLERLSVAAIAELSESMLGPAGRAPQIVELLERETEGNVYFIIEVARALAEEDGALELARTSALPRRVFAGGIDAVLQRRIDQVTPRFRPLLELAAILGREIDLLVLARLAGGLSLDDWLTDCVNAAVLERRDERWRFAHDKLRNRLLATVPVTARQVLFRQVAEAVEAVYGEALAPRAALLAHLWAEAGHGPAVYHYSVMAAELAVELCAYGDARRYYERALGLVVGGSIPRVDRQEIDLRIKLGNIAQAVGAYEQATRELHAAYALARRIDSPRQAAESLLAAGRVFMRQGEMASALRYAVDALAIVETTDDAWLHADTLYFNGVIDLAEGRYEQAKTLLLACLSLLRALGERVQEVNALCALGSAEAALGSAESAMRTLDEALQLAHALGNRALAAAVMGSLGRMAYYNQRPASAARWFEDALPVFRDVGNVFSEATALHFLGFIALANGDEATAFEQLTASITLSRRIGATTVTRIALCGLARLAANRGYSTLAAEWLGLILSQASGASDVDVEREAVPLLNRLADILPAAALDEALRRGQTRSLEAVTAELRALQQALSLPSLI